MTPVQLLWAQLVLSSDIFTTMNRSADPCQDFYQFACGNYDKRVKLPDEEGSIDSFVEVDKRISREIRSVLEEPIGQTDPKSTRLAKMHYKACMNVTELEAVGLRPWKEVIEAAGGWPVLSGTKWKADDYDWMPTLARLFRQYGATAILDIDVATDSKNSSRRILQIDQPGLGLGKREYYLEKNHSKILEAYRRYILGTAIQLGADNQTAERDVQDFLDFETKLANISVRDEERTNFTELYNVISIGELKKRYSKIPLHVFFNDMVEHGWNLTDRTEINVVGGPYISALPDVIATTEKRTLANYQMWDIVRSFSYYIAPSLKYNYRKFRAALFGVYKDSDRWEQCVGAASGDLSLAVASMYVKRYFKSDEKAKMDTMVADIRKSMETVLSHSSWMDEKTKQAALDKLSLLVEKIGYPPYIFNESRILRDKESVEFSDNSYMANAVELTRTAFNATIRTLSRPVNRTDWEMSAASVNAMYSLDFNTITFPAAILQYPFFSPHAPVNVNYGRIGSVIGHEITHGYDDEGRQFGGDGNLLSWWTDETLENFVSGSKCFTEQYGAIIDRTTGYKLNGELELGENIADNGGVKLAYQAYRLRYSESGDVNQSLPSLRNFTTDQLFFISYGQVYCEIIRKESLAESIVSDVHAPSRYRVNVPLSNFDAFASAFHCSRGSRMNPERKCSIW